MDRDIYIAFSVVNKAFILDIISPRAALKYDQPKIIQALLIPLDIVMVYGGMYGFVFLSNNVFIQFVGNHNRTSNHPDFVTRSHIIICPNWDTTKMSSVVHCDTVDIVDSYIIWLGSN